MLPRRHDISRLEGFSGAVFGFALALLAPIAPTAYCLMGPARDAYGSMSENWRRVLDARLPGEASDGAMPASKPPSASRSTV